MKTLIIFISLFWATEVIAQRKNIPVLQDSTVTINELYAGLLSWNAVRVDSLTAGRYVTVRLAGAATWKLNNQLLFNVFGVFETNQLLTPTIIDQFRFQYRPTTKWTINVGTMATPASELRPYPVSSDGQFETWTMTRIPGIVPGAKVRFDVSNALAITTGAALRDRNPEYHVAVALRSVTIASYYQVRSNTFATMVKLSTDKLYSLVVYQSNHVVANTTCYTFARGICLYNDSGIDATGSIVRWESGVLKNFNSTIVSGLLGLGYDAKAKTVNTYLFVHL